MNKSILYKELDEVNITKYSMEFNDTLDDIYALSKKEIVRRGMDLINPPSNITDKRIAEIVNGSPNFTAEKIAVFVDQMTKWLGLTLSNEQFLFAITNVWRVLCEASPGSGKTTMTQIKMLLYKIFYGIRGDDILCLAFNDHAVKDMEKRHTQFAEIINAKRIKGLHVDTKIICRTFNANALAWVVDNAKIFGLKTSSGNNKSNLIISKSEQQNAIEIGMKALGVDKRKIKESTIDAIIALSNVVRECKATKAEYKNFNAYYDIKLEDDDLLEKILDRFEKYKKIKKKPDHTNILQMFEELLEKHEDVAEGIHKAYKIILCDEYQDFTPLKRNILKLMSKKSILICIGDSDQSIYSFIGTDPLNCLKFKETFPESIILTLTENRRCAEEIVDISNMIISQNNMRYAKKVRAVKKGANIRHYNYHTQKGQYNRIVNELKEKFEQDETSVDDVCIAYRNKESSYLLGMLLLEANIPFYIGSGYAPYSDMLSRNIEGLMNLLFYPINKHYQKNFLYKVLPNITRFELNTIVSSAPDNTHFKDLDFSKYRKYAGFNRALENMVEFVSKRSKPMREFFPALFEQLKTYNWKFVSEQNGFPADLEEKIANAYNCDLKYPEFSSRLNIIIERLNKFKIQKQGVYLTTFHGLKGLEFESVKLIDLQDNIFPAFFKIDKGDYSPEIRLSLKEECTRLFNVAVTRAKRNLDFYWSANNPSIYRKLFFGNESVEMNDSELSFASLLNTSLDSLDRDSLDISNFVENSDEEEKADKNAEPLAIPDLNLESLPAQDLSMEIIPIKDLTFDLTTSSSKVTELKVERISETSIEDLVISKPSKEKEEEKKVVNSNSSIVGNPKLQNILNGIKKIQNRPTR